VTDPPSGGPGRRRRRPPGIDPGPRRLAEGLDAALRGLAPPSGAPAPAARSLAAVFAGWEEIVGPTLAGHVWPVGFSGGALVVAADHPAWATRVRMLGAEILVRVGERSGEAPGALRVVVRARPEAGGRDGKDPGGRGVG